MTPEQITEEIKDEQSQITQDAAVRGRELGGSPGQSEDLTRPVPEAETQPPVEHADVSACSPRQETPAEVADPGRLIMRPYQERAITKVHSEHEVVNSTLLVLATGLGKTTIGAELAKTQPGHTLWLAHRQELVEQAAERLRIQTGRTVGIEKAERFATDCEIVVASVQTLAQERRRGSFDPNRFTLVVVDEAHHYVAPSYAEVLKYFEGPKVVGLTATPERADRNALGKIFDSVAMVYDIRDAVRDGWLCQIRCAGVRLSALNLDKVKTTAGDLNSGELDREMSKSEILNGVAEGVVKFGIGRKTLIFASGVETARSLAEMINERDQDSTAVVWGDMPDAARISVVNGFRSGRWKNIVNVNVLTEGFDCPDIGCIAIARPTKSKTLYTQMVGRGTRNAPGKDDLLVLDFFGTSKRHKLVSTTDILGNGDPEVAEAARGISEANPGLTVDEVLARALKAVEESRAIRNVKPVIHEWVNPFSSLGIPAEEATGEFGRHRATAGQKNTLTKLGIPFLDNITKEQATKTLDVAFDRINRGLCTYKQAKLLKKNGYDPANVTFQDASAIITKLVRKWGFMSKRR